MANPSNPQDPTRWRPGRVELAILLFALGIRLLGLSKGLWLDEVSSLQVALADDPVSALRAYDHPPLYFLLLRLWAGLGSSEWFLRLLSVALGIGTVAVAMQWVGSYSRPAGRIAGLFAATLPLFLRYSQELRDYGLLLLAAATAFLLARRLAARPEGAALCCALGAALGVAIAAHMVGILLLPAVAAYALAEAADRRRLLPRLLWVSVSSALVFLGLLGPWLSELPAGREAWLRPPSAAGLATSAHQLLGTDAIAWPLVQARASSGAANGWTFLLLAVAVAASCGGAWRRGGPLLLAASVYWLALLGVAVCVEPVWMARTALPGMLPLLAFGAVQLATLSRRPLRWAGGGAVACLVASFALHWSFAAAWQPHEPWRDLAGALGGAWRPGDVVFVHPPWAAGPLRYYLPELPEEALVEVPLGAAPAAVADAVAARAPAARAFVVLRDSKRSRRDPAREALRRQLDAAYGAADPLHRSRVLALTRRGADPTAIAERR